MGTYPIADSLTLGPSLGETLYGVLTVVVLLAILVAWLRALREIVTRPLEDWVEAGESRIFWFVVVFFVQGFGLLLYLVVARPKLRARQPA